MSGPGVRQQKTACIAGNASIPHNGNEMNPAMRLEQLQKLLAADPNDAFLNFGMAMELGKLQRYDESLAQFDRVLQNDPTYIAAHFHKGKTLIAMGDIPRAKQELELGIQRAQECAEFHAKSEMEELLASL